MKITHQCSFNTRSFKSRHKKFKQCCNRAAYEIKINWNSGTESVHYVCEQHKWLYKTEINDHEIIEL